MLCELVNAYNKMISGQTVIDVRLDGEITRYERARDGEKLLMDQIRRLHQVCGNEISAAVTGMPLSGRRPAGLCYR